MITLRWSNPNPSHIALDEIRIYRSGVPMDPDNLPLALATLSGDTVLFKDETADNDAVYYYRVEFVRGDELGLSQERAARTDGSQGQPLNLPPAACEAGYAYDSLGNLLYTLDGDKVLNDWASTRKILAAVIVLEEKGEVLSSELVTVTDEDINSTGPEFRSGLQDGDQVTWQDILELMLVASMSDVSATITRVLGEELRLKYGIGATPAQAIGYWMSTAALRAGARNTITLTNNSVSISPPPGEFLADNMLTTPHQLARCLHFVTQIPDLLAIMKMPSVTVSVQGPNSRTITHGSIDRLRAAWSSVGELTGYEFDGYIAGKTGDSTWGNQAFACEMPSGDALYGTVYKSATRDLRVRDIIRVIMAAENHYPHLRSSEIEADPHHGQVAFRILGGAPIIDIGPAARPITNDGVTTQPTEYMTGTALEFGGSSTITVGGPAPALGADDFTLDVFIRGVSSLPASPFILAGQWRAIPNGRGWMVQVENDRIDVFYSTTGNDQHSVSHTIPMAYLLNGSPTHVCVMRSGADLALFFNGVRSEVHSIGSASIYVPAGSPVMVGGRQDSGAGRERYYRGFVDEATLTLGVARYGMAGFRPRYRPGRWD